MGFKITVNGDQFNTQTLFIPPTDANYTNLYFDFKEDVRAKRTVLVGFKPIILYNYLLMRLHSGGNKVITASGTFKVKRLKDRN